MCQQGGAADITRLGEGDDRHIANGRIFGLQNSRPEFADGLIAGFVLQHHFTFNGYIAPATVAFVDFGCDLETARVGHVISAGIAGRQQGGDKNAG